MVTSNLGKVKRLFSQSFGGTSCLKPPSAVYYTKKKGASALAPRSMMWVYLTFDHRVVDGLEVGKVFRELQYLLEHPHLITA